MRSKTAAQDGSKINFLLTPLSKNTLFSFGAQRVFLFFRKFKMGIEREDFFEKLWYDSDTENSGRANANKKGGDAKAENMKNKEVYRQQVLDELAAVGFFRVGDCLKLDGQKLMLKKLGGKAGAAIASVEQTGSGIKVKFYDKLKALSLLGELTGAFGSACQEKHTENNLLECILQATEGAVDISDIPEIQQAADAGDDLVEPTEP